MTERAPAERGLAPRARLILWTPVFLLIAYEAFVSSQSHPPSLPLDFPESDKVVHAGYFFLTALLAFRAGRFGEGWSRRRTALILLAGAALYGTIDEVHQSFVPHRDADVKDVLADVAGASLATLLSEPLLKRLRLDRTVA